MKKVIKYLRKKYIKFLEKKIKIHNFFEKYLFKGKLKLENKTRFYQPLILMGGYNPNR